MTFGASAFYNRQTTAEWHVSLEDAEMYEQADPNQRDEVPLPANGVPRRFGGAPAGTFTQQQAATVQQQYYLAQGMQVQQPVAQEESLADAIQERLQALDLGAKCGLFQLADYVAHAVAAYQQQYQQQTGQEISFQNALTQLINTLSIVAD